MKIKKNFFNWIKPWIFCKLKIIFFFLIIIKNNKIKNKIMFNLLNSKNTFFYEYSEIIKKINEIIIKNIIKIKNKKKININKLKILEITILNNNIFYYKIETNNKIKKIRDIYNLINNIFFWKKNNILFIIIFTIININISIIKINNKKKTNIIYKICGKNLDKINILKIQQIIGLFSWVFKASTYLANKLFISIYN